MTPQSHRRAQRVMLAKKAVVANELDVGDEWGFLIPYYTPGFRCDDLDPRGGLGELLAQIRAGQDSGSDIEEEGSVDGAAITRPPSSSSVRGSELSVDELLLQ